MPAAGGAQPLASTDALQVIYGEHEDFFADAAVYRKAGGSGTYVLHLPRARAVLLALPGVAGGTGPAYYAGVVLAAAWALYEYLKSVGFLGYPWGLVAYPLGDFLPLVQFIDTTGGGGSVWVRLLGALSFYARHLNSTRGVVAVGAQVGPVRGVIPRARVARHEVPAPDLRQFTA